MLVELRASIHISSIDAVEKSLRDTRAFNVNQSRGEQRLRSHVTLTADLDDTTVGECVLLNQNGGLSRKTSLEVDVISAVAQLLLEHTDSLEVGGSVEGITAEKEQLNEVLGDITTSNINTLGQVRKSETLIDGDDVRDTITRIENDTSQETLSVEGQDSLDGDVGCLEAVLLEHNLKHTLTVLDGVKRGLGKENLALVGVNLQLGVESVVPDMVHIIEVSDNTMRQGVSDLEHLTELGSLITDHDILRNERFFVKTCHHSRG
jgi:hypothetical protein